MPMTKLDEGVAFGALSLAIVQTFTMYRDAAPSLSELRAASPGDFTQRQLLLDADLLGLITVLALGGGGAILIRRWYPLLLAGVGLLLISAYHRSVLNSSNEGLCSGAGKQENVSPPVSLGSGY